MSKILPAIHKNLHYEVFGEGEPMILHQGLGRTSLHWLGFEQQLAKYYKVIVFDTRGLGKSKDLPAPLGLSIFSFADDLKDLFQELKITKAHILGISLGGMACLAFAERYPQYVKSLTIINSSIGGTLTPRITPLGFLSLAVGGFSSRLTAMALSYTLVGRTLTKNRRLALQKEWEEIDKDHAPNKRTVLHHLLAALRFSKTLQFHKISCPVLILYGSQDLFVPQKNSRNIYKLLPNAEIKEIQGGGHEMYLEKPTEIIRTINNFIQKNVSP